MARWEVDGIMTGTDGSKIGIKVSIGSSISCRGGCGGSKGGNGDSGGSKGGNGDSGGNKGGNGDSGGSKSSDVTFSGRALQWRISGRESRGSPAASIGKPANVMTHQFNNSPF